MSGAAFTPGPWIEGQDGNLRVYGPDGMGEHSGLIAVVHKGRANVRLIAAAPELFEALASLVGPDLHYDGKNICIPNASHVDGITLVTRARAALAKARGDQ